jgi:hypothetical protein
MRYEFEAMLLLVPAEQSQVRLEMRHVLLAGGHIQEAAHGHSGRHVHADAVNPKLACGAGLAAARTFTPCCRREGGTVLPP